MIYIVADLEATCWEKNTSEKRQEIIEIGAVKLNHRFKKTDEFNRFIRPVENPTLSNFCKDFTHISQNDVDSADTFNIVFPQFLKWIGKRSYTVVHGDVMISNRCS